MKKDIIKVKNLSKDYYQYKVFKKGKLLTKALKNVSFTVKEGDFFGLLGQNGAGKTTLMKILTTNLKQTAGKAHIANIDMDKNIRKIKNNISWMFGVDYEGYGWSSIEKNLHLAASYLGLSKEQTEKRVTYLLKYFDLYNKRKLDVWRMSAGMQAKYALAAAMLKQPKILFLDEPLLGLDVPAKETLRQFLLELNKQGTTIIYTDHQLHEMEKVCNNLVIIEQGEKMYDGNLDKLKQQYRDTNVLELTCQSPTINRTLLQIKKQKKYVQDYVILDSEAGIHQVKIYTNIDSKQALLKVGNYLCQKKVVIQSLNAGLLSLEDVFKKFINKKPHQKHLHTLQGFHKTNEQPLANQTTYLKHKHHEIRGAACSLLLHKKRKQVEQTLKKMSKLNTNMQLESLRVIGDAKDRKLLGQIKDRLNTKNKEVQEALVITQAKLGYKQVVQKVLHYLLQETSCKKILNNIKHFTSNIQHELGEHTKKLKIHDRLYLIYHLEKHKDKQQLYHTLHIKHKDYKEWKKAKQRKMIIHGKVKK